MDDSSYVPGLLEGLNEKYVRTSDHHLSMGGSPHSPLPPPLLPPPLPLSPLILPWATDPQRSVSTYPCQLIFNHPSSGWLCSSCAGLLSVPWTHPTCSHLRTFAQAGKLSPDLGMEDSLSSLGPELEGHLLKDAFHKHHVKPLPVVYPQSQHPVFFIALTFWSGLIDLSPVSSHEWQRPRLSYFLLLTWHLKHYWVQKSGSKQTPKAVTHHHCIHSAHAILHPRIQYVHTAILCIGLAGCVRQNRDERDRENVNDLKEKE